MPRMRGQTSSERRAVLEPWQALRCLDWEMQSTSSNEGVCSVSQAQEQADLFRQVGGKAGVLDEKLVDQVVICDPESALRKVASS